MSRKKSFFERLTGSIRMDSDEFAELNEHELSEEEQEHDIGIPEEGELAVDVYETNDAIVIQAMTSGTRKNDLDITISRDQVVIRGERHSDARIHQDSYTTQELYWGAFSRTIDLAEEVEVEEAMAREQHGLLTIRLPKIDKNKQAKLKVE